MEKLTAITEARKDPGEYWKEIMKDQKMPEGLQGLLPFESENNAKTQEHLVKDSKHECEETEEKKVFTEDLDTKMGKPHFKSDFKNDKFEPRPSATKYDDSKVRLNVDLDPRPSVTNYGDSKFRSNAIKNEDFEPRPSATKYGDFELKLSINKMDDIEPRPSVTKYDDFEPRPSATKYDN